LLFAEQELELNTLQDDGSTLNDHLKSLWRQTGRKPDQLERVEFPPLMRAVWSHFLELNNARTSNGFGANPLTYAEIYAWNNLTGANVSADDVRIIKQLDNVYLHYQAQQTKKG
jgi:hypothetical protein